MEATPRRLFSNAHTYHINSISVNSDDCTYLSADDLRINVWHLETTDQSFSILQSRLLHGGMHVCLVVSLTSLLDIVDIKPANMEELTEVITAAQFHPVNCNEFIYSSSKGTVRLCDMRAKALCDQHAKS